MNSTNNWGGKRENSGRKKTGGKLAIDSTKVVRVSLTDYDRIRNRSYQRIIEIFQKYQFEKENSYDQGKGTKWRKYKEMMAEIKQILGDDWVTWDN